MGKILQKLQLCNTLVHATPSHSGLDSIFSHSLSFRKVSINPRRSWTDWQVPTCIYDITKTTAGEQPTGSPGNNEEEFHWSVMIT